MGQLKNKQIIDQAKKAFNLLKSLPIEEKISCINELRKELSVHSPFAKEPVDLVTWAPAISIRANDYNPNSVAPPEMRLLEHSILSDGYTQPIVAWRTSNNLYEVVDGFHRNRVGRECKEISNRVHGYLPLSIINGSRSERSDRISATIRHNRARGKHRVDAMSDIVVELKQRNWSDSKISKELGMEPDEVLRLSQISGLASMFADSDFSASWETDKVDETELFKLEDAL